MTERRRVALVLGSGGARGLAHIGAIEAIEARGLDIVLVAGSSMGAVVGGIHAAGRLDAYRDWVVTLARSQVLRLVDVVWGSPGLVRGQRVMEAMTALVGEHRIEDLQLPFVAVACDLATQRQVWLTHGPLMDAIRASFAIPGVFTPHLVDGRELVDGGLLAPVPIAAARLASADLVVAVDVNGRPDASVAGSAGGRAGARLARDADSRTDAHAAGDANDRTDASTAGDVAGSGRAATELAASTQTEPTTTGSDAAQPASAYTARLAEFIDSLRHRKPAAPPQPGVLDLMSRSLDTMQGALGRLQLAMDPPDVLVRIPRDACTFYEFWRAAELITLGREATHRALDAAGL